jgi:hypothetical protein
MLADEAAAGLNPAAGAAPPDLPGSRRQDTPHELRKPIGRRNRMRASRQVRIVKQ